MKKYFAVFTSLLLTAPFAQSQQPNQSAPGQPQQQQTGVPSQPQSQDQFRNSSQPGATGREGTIFNQPAGANQPQPNQFGGTNQVRFGTTNQVQFGTTNNQTFLPTNQAQLVGPNRGFAVGTNIQPGTQLNEAAGAVATNQFQGGQAGLTNQAGANLADQAFALQMRAVLSRPGAAQIFFPQTRSTISVVNQNGALTLQGFVTSDEEKRAIEARIQNSPGVTSIDNQLQVGNGQNPGITPRTPGLNPAPNSQINPEERRLLNP